MAEKEKTTKLRESIDAMIGRVILRVEEEVIPSPERTEIVILLRDAQKVFVNHTKEVAGAASR